MQQSEDNGTERAVLVENSFKDEFDEKFGKDRGSDGRLMQISRKLFLTHYVHNESPTLNIARCAVFRKRKKPPQPPKN